MSAGSASIFIATWLVISLSNPAWAYLDPVSGSFLVQGLIAGVVAILAAIRRVRERVLGLLGLSKSDVVNKQTSKSPAVPAKPAAKDTQRS